MKEDKTRDQRMIKRIWNSGMCEGPVIQFSMMQLSLMVDSFLAALVSAQVLKSTSVTASAAKSTIISWAAPLKFNIPLQHFSIDTPAL